MPIHTAVIFCKNTLAAFSNTVELCRLQLVNVYIGCVAWAPIGCRMVAMLTCYYGYRRYFYDVQFYLQKSIVLVNVLNLQALRLAHPVAR